MITLVDYYMGRDRGFATELTPEIRANAAETVRRVNLLLEAYQKATGIVISKINSGWRPAAINAATPNAAKRSKHMLALACDLRDADGALDKWCLANLPALERIGLWLEAPAATPGWCHVQTIAPKSGNRVFNP